MYSQPSCHELHIEQLVNINTHLHLVTINTHLQVVTINIHLHLVTINTHLQLVTINIHLQRQQYTYNPRVMNSILNS